ncbi:hypothetical protein HN51_044672 [Arachis hypogaea]
MISIVAVEGPSPWTWRGAAVHACRHQKRSRCHRRLSLEKTPYRRASGRQNHGPGRRGLPLLLLLLRTFIVRENLTLPDSIYDLHNLQILLLTNYPKLTSLPKRICDLISLRYLDIRGSSVQEIP